MKVFLTTFLFTVLIFNAYSQEQDSLILLNGKVIRGEIKGADVDFINLKELDKKGRVYDTKIEKYRVFSYTQGGMETVVYQQNDEFNNFLSVKEAKHVSLGSYDARQNFKPHFVFWSSFALGLTASIWDTYLLQKSIDNEAYIGPHTSGGFFKSKPSLFPVLAPVILSVGWSFPSFKVKEKDMIQKHLLNDVDYYRGFHRIAKQKRMLGALKGSVLGIAAGMVTYAVFKP